MLTIEDAIKSLYPQTTWSMQNGDYETLEWPQQPDAKPTKQQLLDEFNRLIVNAP